MDLFKNKNNALGFYKSALCFLLFHRIVSIISTARDKPKYRNHIAMTAVNTSVEKSAVFSSRPMN